MTSSCLWKFNFLAFRSSPPFRHASFTRYPSIRRSLVSHPIYCCKFLGGTVVSSSTSHANLIKKFDCDKLSWLVELKKLSRSYSRVHWKGQKFEFLSHYIRAFIRKCQPHHHKLVPVLQWGAFLCTKTQIHEIKNQKTDDTRFSFCGCNFVFSSGG